MSWQIFIPRGYSADRSLSDKAPWLAKGRHRGAGRPSGGVGLVEGFFLAVICSGRGWGFSQKGPNGAKDLMARNYNRLQVSDRSRHKDLEEGRTWSRRRESRTPPDPSERRPKEVPDDEGKGPEAGTRGVESLRVLCARFRAAGANFSAEVHFSNARSGGSWSWGFVISRD